MTDLAEVLRRLPKLSPDELEQVRQRLSILRGMDAALTTFGGTSPSKDDAGAERVLSAIARILQQAGLEHVNTTMLRASPAFPAFRKKLPTLMEYLSKVSPNAIEQSAVLLVGVDLLRRYLIKQKLPVGSRVLMQHIHRVPAVLDLQFPGYAAAGMLGWIARRPTS